jgi:hypothetical protein
MKAVLLKNGSTTEKEWEHPTVPLYNKYYFLDVTNAYEVQTMGAKPSFTERGPYVYRSVVDRVLVMLYIPQCLSVCLSECLSICLHVCLLYS